MRIKIGDIIINKWASNNAIDRKGIYVGSGVVLSTTDKNVYFSHYDMRKVDKDKDHFIVVGHYPIRQELTSIINNITNSVK